MHENMASFTVIRGERATAFQNSPLLHVFCVSKEDFLTRPIGWPCVNLVCRQVHVSFVNKMSERTISLIPLKNGRVGMEDVFSNVSSPMWISLRASCDYKLKFAAHFFCFVLGGKQGVIGVVKVCSQRERVTLISELS